MPLATYDLQLRQRQQLALTPAVLQSIKLLQLPALEFEEVLKAVADENPLLEVQFSPDPDFVRVTEGPVLTANWQPSGRGARYTDVDESAEMDFAAPSMGLRDSLLEQISAARVDGDLRLLVMALIHELNEDGYVEASLSDIASFLNQYQSVSLAELETALGVLQGFEPAGVGARSLSECLLLQLQRIESNAGSSSKILRLAKDIARHHLHALAKGGLALLNKRLQHGADAISSACSLILSLDPRPARRLDPDLPVYLVPDVFAQRVSGRWVAALNPDTVPRVRVHEQVDVLQSLMDSVHPLREKAQQARELVRAVNSRFETLLLVSQAIVGWQQDYFDHGVDALKPLVLNDVAQMLDLHESTVSRATRGKYIQTPKGVVELRALLGSSFPSGGGAVATGEAIQQRILALIHDEPRHKPLSDARIVDLLADQGIQIARRTVAKYRDELGVAAASRRRVQYELTAPDRTP